MDAEPLKRLTWDEIAKDKDGKAKMRLLEPEKVRPMTNFYVPPPITNDDIKRQFPDVLHIETVRPGHVVFTVLEHNQEWVDTLNELRNDMPAGAYIEVQGIDYLFSKSLQLLEHFGGI